MDAFNVSILILLLVGIIYLKVKYPTIKGMVGEHFVNRKLSKLDSNYRVFHDLYVPNDRGGTSQIDHLVTSPYGIFVIETKHYDGWIFGSEKQKYWTQVIYKRKEKLYNPIWQNYGHIQSFKKYLTMEDNNMLYSIIAFSSQSTFKFKEDFKSAKVIQTPQLLKTIEEYNLEKLTVVQLESINQAIEKLIIKDKKEKKRVKKKHVQIIRDNRRVKDLNKKSQKHSNQTKELASVEQIFPTEQVSCPTCGGNLLLKKGKYGEFYGCSNFPKCKFTRKVS